ncbi:MAG: hypothetical protein AB7F89_25010, partial [Pirellulaceae bacterium]
VEPEENLLVFGGKLPRDDQMRRIDTLLVARGTPPAITDEATWRSHQQAAIARLRGLTFRNIQPAFVPRRKDFRADGRADATVFGTYAFDTADGMTLGIKTARPVSAPHQTTTFVCAVQPDARSTFAGGGASRPRVPDPFATAAVEVRNTGATSMGPGYLWTARRVYPLLGQTLPERQVSDLLAAINLLRSEEVAQPVVLYGDGYTAPLAIYAALLDPQVSEVVLANPPISHEDPQTPEMLGVLRIGDLPHNLALMFPRPITFVGRIPAEYQWTRQVYERLGAADRVRVIGQIRDWQPHPSSTPR